MAAPALAVIGHNSGPDPFEAHRVNIEDLFSEAKNWLDGDPIASQEAADKVQQLLRMIQEAHKAADAERVKENIPFDEGKAEVQAKYAPLIADTKSVKGKTVLATGACKKALSPWLAKVAAEQAAAAKALRDAAEVVAAKAAEAMRQAPADDLTARETAEDAVSTAKAAEQAARAAGKARPQASGYGRAATLRDNWQPSLVDAQAAARHYWTINPQAFNAVLSKLAQDDVASGKRQIPGFEIVNRPSVV